MHIMWQYSTPTLALCIILYSNYKHSCMHSTAGDLRVPLHLFKPSTMDYLIYTLASSQMLLHSVKKYFHMTQGW